MRGHSPPPAHLGVCLGGAALLDLAAIWPEAVGGAALVVPLGLNPGKSDSVPSCLPASWALQLLVRAIHPLPHFE